MNLSKKQIYTFFGVAVVLFVGVGLFWPKENIVSNLSAAKYAIQNFQSSSTDYSLHDTAVHEIGKTKEELFFGKGCEIENRLLGSNGSNFRTDFNIENSRIYYCTSDDCKTTEIIGADAESFVSLTDGFFSDKNNVYHCTRLGEGDKADCTVVDKKMQFPLLDIGFTKESNMVVAQEGKYYRADNLKSDQEIYPNYSSFAEIPFENEVPMHYVDWTNIIEAKGTKVSIQEFGIPRVHSIYLSTTTLYAYPFRVKIENKHGAFVIYPPQSCTENFPGIIDEYERGSIYDMDTGKARFDIKKNILLSPGGRFVAIKRGASLQVVDTFRGIDVLESFTEHEEKYYPIFIFGNLAEQVVFSPDDRGFIIRNNYEAPGEDAGGGAPVIFFWHERMPYELSIIAKKDTTEDTLGNYLDSSYIGAFFTSPHTLEITEGINDTSSTSSIELPDWL